MWLKSVVCFLLITTDVVISQSGRSKNAKRAVIEEGDDGRSSLVFVFDTTGSMYNDLRQLREGAEMILKTALDESDVIADFVFVPFHDPVVGPATVTSDKEVFKAALNIVHVYGGGDCPEKSLGGIQLALNVSRPRSFLYVFTDATAGDHRLVGKVLDAVQRKQSQVVFVLTGHCNDLHKPSYKVYQQIAAASSGQVFNLNKTSVHEVLDFVRNAIKGRTVNLGSVIKPAGSNFTQGIPVDSTVGEVTVSVSGAKPHIKVVDPSGQELVGPPKLVKTLDLSEIMVVKVLEPEPGNWSITVGSENDYSVKVVGLSNLTFDHGFSVETPSSMAETSYRPLQGTYNHMMLSLSGTDKPLHLEYAEVLNLSGKTLFEVPLREIDKDKHLYLTSAFVPPDDFFYIAINGKDEFNQEVRRVGATAVQSKPPDVPYLVTNHKIEAHSHTHILLKCYVESLVPVTAKWTKDMIATQPEISSLQTTTIEYVIEDMTEEDVGTYTCIAKNVAGISKAVTEVILLVDPPQVAVEPGNITVELGESVVITCTVLSEALLLKHQLVFNGNDTVYAININLEPNIEGYYKFIQSIHNATEKDTGTYICIAANRGGEVKQSTNILVNVQPFSQILGSHPLSVTYNTNAQLTCHVENAELLQWIAPNGSVIERKINGISTETLDVNNVVEDGIWQCVALRGALNASDSVELEALIHPNASIIGSNNVTVLNGTIHEITCEVTAKPKPKILWFKGRDRLSTRAFQNVRIESNVYRSVLTLNTSREDIQGNYVCFADNSAGTSKDNVTVKVRRKMTLLEGFNDSAVELHTQLVLQCKVDAYPPPKIRWFHNTTQLSTTDKVHLSEDSNVITFDTVDVENLGFYSCEADNGFENLRVNGTITIIGLDVPHLTTTVKIEAYSHDRVFLKCDVQSIVPVTAKWTKEMSPIQPEISSLQTTTVEYIIENMTEDDIGNYTCVAKNVVGMSKAVTEVILLVKPPQVTVKPDSSNIDEEEDLVVSCTAFSDVLPLKYQLVFNGTEKDYVFNLSLERNVEGVYKFDKTIRNVTEKVSGLYTCIAANRGGESRQSTNIVVKPRPISQILGSHSLSVVYNTSIKINCRVENAELVHWIAPNGSIVERHVRGSSTETYDVNNIIEDESWQCVAIRGRLKALDSIQLAVLIKPNASILGSDNITVLNGTICEIVCEVDAKPIPKIVWYRGRDKMSPKTYQTVSSQPNVFLSVLTLNSSKEDVQGNYVCSAENSVGTDRDNVTVKVRRKMTLLQGFNDSAVELYSQLELQCKVDAHPPPKLHWFHNTTRLSTTDKVHISEDGTTVYLKMVDFNNLGLYSCEADNGFETMRANGTLSVSGLEIPFISKDIKKIIVRKGDSTKIACRVVKGKPEASIAWQYKGNNSKDFITLPQNTSVDESDEVVILNASVEHSGIYRCVADNILGSDKHDFQLIVQYPPALSLPVEDNTQKKTHEVKAGEKVEFSCDAVGYPMPITVWTKDGQALAYSKNVHLSNENHLIIEKASRYDSGLFTCNATSSLGSVHRNFTLYVYVPPKITQVGNETLQEMLEGQLVELPCVADGEPTPQVQWIHNGNVIEHGRKYVDEFGLRFVANLTDFGNYTCNAWSPYGNTSVSYSLYIWVPPYIEPPVEVSQNVLIGANVTLQCDVIGFPIPEVVWEFQGDLLSDNTENLSFNNDGDLYITNVSSKHEGVYDCVAENLAGFAKKSIYLKVNEPPKIIDDNYTGPYVATHKDTALILTCKGIGMPRPYVVWSKDGLYLDIDKRYEVAADGTLTIKSPTEEESGNYTCNVKNPYGSVNKTFAVHIYSLPTNMQSDETQSKLTLLEGTNATINCPVLASATDTVKWYKEAVLITNGTLQITNVTRSDASTFACVVSNVAGSGYATVSINVEWKPKFIHDAKRIISVVVGDDTYLDCQVDAKPVPKTKWLFNSKRLVFQEKYRLKLMSVKQHEAGTYKCIVSNVHGTIVREFKLVPLIPPFISEFDLLDVFLKEGANATLECNAKGLPRPNLEWTYNNTNWLLKNSTLVSTNITSLSEGLFRCDARNKAGTAHLVYRIEVVTSARIKEIVSFTSREGVTVDRTVEVLLNTRARISCQATGKPPPIIQWLRNGRTVGSNPPNIDYADLILENTQTIQAGVYTCLSSNEGGSDEKKIKVDVLEPPQIFQALFQNANVSQNDISIEVISGQAFYLHCHPYGNPLPEVYWFKDDLPLRFYDDTMVSTEFSEVIVVKKATEEQTGNYTCVAKNKVGNTSVSYLVDVLVPPPKPKEAMRQVATRFGKDLTLSCPVEGTPLPNVMWIKHPYTEINEDTPRILLLEDNFILIISKTEVSDSGNYSCIMTNKVGTTEVVFQVTVQKPPHIVGNKATDMVESHVVPLRRSLILKCEVEGNPTPKITWLKDTQQLSDSLSNIHRVLGNSLLAIWSANVRDAGQYICVAENEAGAQHRRFNVAIRVPGKWSSWNEWTICNVTCGLGYQMRTRFCHYIDENNNTIDNTTHSEKIVLDEMACKGSVAERRKCHMPPCDSEVNVAKWSLWSKWSTCSSSCGVGTQARTRRCKSKAKCIGDNVQIRKCPDLPQCERHQGQQGTSEDVFDSKEDSNDTSLYLPEAVYEMAPAVMTHSHYSPDNEDLYLAGGSKKSMVYEVNVTDNLDQSQRGPCEPGFSQNPTNNSCDDIDECVMENNHCHSTQVCVNTKGGYQCTCPSGYVSLGLGQRCLDVNECEQEIHGCEYACVNVAGGYVCACPRHLRLHVDKHHCVQPSLYQRPYDELENGEYMSTSVEAPGKYSRNMEY